MGRASRPGCGCRRARTDPPTMPPVPAVLEYIPYRKRDGTRGPRRPHARVLRPAGLCGHPGRPAGGRASRTGSSTTNIWRRSRRTPVAVIAWIAHQSWWLSGAVGMMGKSWGGFNALQVAARRPPALKAIITVCSTDDRFATDIHYAWVAACSTTICGGAPSCWATRAGRRILRSAPIGASDGWSGSTTCRSGRPCGSPIRRATPIGNTARSARTGTPSRVRFSRSAGGATLIPMPYPACSRVSAFPGVASSGPGPTSIRRTAAPAPPSTSWARPCAGGTSG